MKLVLKSKAALALTAALSFAGAAGAADFREMGHQAPVFDSANTAEVVKDVRAAFFPHGQKAEMLAASHPAQVILEKASDAMMNALQANKNVLKNNPDHIYTLLETHLLPHFDFERAAKGVLGKYYRRATDEQLDRFTDAFRTISVNYYSKALLLFDGVEVDYKSYDVSSTGDRVLVRSEIKQSSGNKIAVDYRMERNGKSGDWKIYDVIAEGFSFGMTYRNMMADSISRKGLEGAIQDMEREASGMYKPKDNAGLEKPSAPVLAGNAPDAIKPRMP